MFHRSKIAASLGFVLAIATPASAKSALIHLHGQFIDEHGATNRISGGVGATLDTKTGNLSYRIHYAGLTGPVIAAHLHGPAEPGQDAGVLAPITGPVDGHVLHGILHVAPDQIQAVIDGKSYINLHTQAHADGEARAQLIGLAHVQPVN